MQHGDMTAVKTAARGHGRLAETSERVGRSVLEEPDEGSEARSSPSRTYVGVLKALGPTTRLNKRGRPYRLDALVLKEAAGRYRVFYGRMLRLLCETAGLKSGDAIAVTLGATPGHGRSPHPRVLAIQKASEPKVAMRNEAQQTPRAMRRFEALKRAHIRRVWDESVSVDANDPTGVIGYRYLASRGIRLASGAWVEDLRVHPGLPYCDENGKRLGVFPCLVAAVRDPAGAIVTLHRTYLTADGRKAGVATPKKLMPVPTGLSTSGGAIRLSKATHTLSVAEGIETALSVTMMTGEACWATVSANGMRQFVIPEGVRMLRIYADKDRSGVGREAAEMLATRARAAGVTVEILEPELAIAENQKGVDFNDVLQRQRALKGLAL